jgi:hypothetical protein
LIRRGADFDPDHTGETISTYVIVGLCHSAQCRIRVMGLDVVAHELGHALGLEHVTKKGHVMNRRYSRLGLSFAGVREAFRGAYGSH